MHRLFLIGALVGRWIDSKITVKFSRRLLLVAVAYRTKYCVLPWLENPDTGFLLTGLNELHSSLYICNH